MIYAVQFAMHTKENFKNLTCRTLLQMNFLRIKYIFDASFFNLIPF